LKDGTQSSFTSLDQNWSQPERVTVETHNYNNVSGWLRPKKQAGGTITVDSKIYEDLVRDATLWKDEHPKTVKLLQDNENTNKEKDQTITSLRDEAVRLRNEIAELKSANTTLNSKVIDLTAAMEKDAVHDRDLEVKNTELEREITNLNKQIVELKEEKAKPAEEAKDEVIQEWQPVMEELFKNVFKGKKARSLIDRIWGWIA
jgi:chromosome segregation ATPase